jgi:hypothetical protein
MSLFKEFEELFPYLISVRKLKTYLSFDIEFPETWKLPKKYVNEERVVENSKQREGVRNFSFVSEFNETSVDDLISNIKNIIFYNKEREEKEKLFENKVNELKKIFEKQNLKNLQELTFEITSKIKLDDEEEETTDTKGASPDMVSK